MQTIREARQLIEVRARLHHHHELRRRIEGVEQIAQKAQTVGDGAGRRRQLEAQRSQWHARADWRQPQPARAGDERRPRAAPPRRKAAEQVDRNIERFERCQRPAPANGQLRGHVDQMSMRQRLADGEAPAVQQVGTLEQALRV